MEQSKCKLPVVRLFKISGKSVCWSKKIPRLTIGVHSIYSISTIVRVNLGRAGYISLGDRDPPINITRWV